MIQAALFTFFSLLAVVAGLAVITLRNPISSGLALVGSFFCLAAMYAMLGAQLVAVIQVLVYAGAIMVLFLFVIMLLNLREEVARPWGDLSPRALWSIAAGMALGGALIVAGAGGVAHHARLPEDFGTIAAVGRSIFNGHWLLAFELTSALLTVAVVGAVVLGRRRS